MGIVHRKTAMIALAGVILVGLARSADAADTATKKITANQCIESQAKPASGGVINWQVNNICAESVRVVLCFAAGPQGATEQNLIGHFTCSITVLDPHQVRSGTTTIASHPGDWLYKTHGSCFLSMGNKHCYQLAVDMKNRYEGRK